MGGGQIIKEGEEWTLSRLLKVAAGFPAHVAKSPQRTHAILTKYDRNLDFVQWAERKGIKVKQYESAQLYAGDLLDMYMEYKVSGMLSPSAHASNAKYLAQNNLSIIRGALSTPSAYRASELRGAVPLSFDLLAAERRRMRKEMEKIVVEIDLL
jgi:hypothetical protein